LIDAYLRQVVAARDTVVGLYGMGSFFRGRPYNDIDFVVVLSCRIDKFLGEAKSIRTELRAIGDSLGERFDVTISTVSEFASAPLRDMGTLVAIYQQESGS
jgi:hypothetical protein